MDKRSLISESVVMIQISVHLAREEPNRHIIHVAPGVSRMTNTRKVPTKSNLGPCSRDEVLASSDSLARPSSWAASFSLQQTTSKQGGMIWQTSYWATRFTWPHKPTCSHYKSRLAIGAKTMWSLIDTGGGYHLGIATTQSPPFPSEWSTFPYLTHPITSTNMNINFYSSNPNYPSSSWKRGPTRDWDRPLVFYWWLSTKHSTSSQIKIIHLQQR
jgi:hypothetical protein